MDVDKTQQQSSEGQRKAKQLSLRQSTPPADVPGHELQQFLGAGAYGEVWVGINLTTRRKVAIKFFLYQDVVDWSLLDRETEKMALLSSDRYVVQLLHVGWDSDPRYYVMEYVENGSLEDYLREHDSLSVSEAVSIFREVVIGLTHAHAKAVLHCDLKPANILLDEDNKPRLADFGQSRLASEQSPALGTLFFMAPEQADLNARPDVRWDIYALGALLHTLLVGHPPHQSDGNVQKIDTAASLVKRLACYRELIQTADRPTAHRQVRGVDGALIEIVDRCLAPDPRERYSTVREVLDALDARTASRSRRPLMVLGVLGPILLLFIMLLFGWRGYQKAVGAIEHSTDSVRRHAYESNTNASKYVAIALRAEIESILRIAETEAGESDLATVASVANQTPLAEQLSGMEKSAAKTDPRLKEFRALAESKRLTDYLKSRLDIYLEKEKRDRNAPRLASMFVMNDAGVILGVAYADKKIVTESVGRQYRYRTYFNGQKEDLDPTSDSLTDVRPLTAPYFSAPFQSTTTKKWKVAISVPFEDGIFVVTVNLGEFTSLRAHTKNGASRLSDSQIATIIYDRPGDRRGMILQHPHFTELAKLEVDYRIPKEVLTVLERPISPDAEEWGDAWKFNYFDPLAKSPGGERYDGPWIATVATVAWADESTTPHANATDLLVMLQEREETVIAPVKALSWELFKEAAFAGCGFVLTVFVLWYIVWRATRDPHDTTRRSVATSAATSLHQRATAVDPGKGARRAPAKRGPS